MAAKVNEGDDFIKLSLIFKRTTNPASINIASPPDANRSKAGL